MVPQRVKLACKPSHNKTGNSPRVMCARLEMEDEREIGPREYVEERRYYRYGEEIHRGSCRGELLQCGQCQFQAGHNSRTCRYIRKVCRECGLWRHSKSECVRRREMGREGRRNKGKYGTGSRERKERR